MSLQPVVQQMLDDLWNKALNNSSSPWYLPTLITKAGFAPSYAAGNWAVGTITGDGGNQAAQNICAATGPLDDNSIPTPGSLPDLQLSQVVLKYLDHVSMPQAPQASGPDGLTITATLLFTGIEIDGSFVLTQSCCLTDDLQTCRPGTTSSQVGKGTFTLTIGGKSTAVAVTHISALAPNTLTVVADSIRYTVDYTQMVATVDIQNITDPNQRDKWNIQAAKAFNYLPTQTVMVAAMNADLGGPGPLQQVGQQLTSYIDNYLQSTHQYPYDSSFRSVFS